MSFLLSQNAPALNVRGANDIALLHKLECRACPLDKTAMGKMAPTGAERPLVYILGEGPGATEVELREQFVGDSGQILRSRIPRHLRDKIRFNNVVRCFISPKVKVLTSEGYKFITNVAVDDLVLTHKGKFRRVISRLHDLPLDQRSYYEDLVEVYVTKQDFGQKGLPPRTVKQTVTKLHRYLKSDGTWVLASDLRTGDYIQVLAHECVRCGKLFYGYDRSSVHCSATCRNRDLIADPKVRAKIGESTKLAVKEGRKKPLSAYEHLKQAKIRELVAAGKHNLQNLTKAQRWKARVSTKYSKKGENEDLFKDALSASDFKVEMHYSIPVPEENTICVYDLFLPELGILIEIDGKSHNNRKVWARDAFKDRVARDNGYIIIRRKHTDDPKKLIAQVRRLESNHNGEYKFISVPVRVRRRRNKKRIALYCLEVEGDSSFIANGIVSHNSRPPGNATPEFAEIECCRPSVVKDVERSKPKAIFGFGNVPLEWVSGFSGVTLWRGRRMPVKVGSHTCWFYPMLHPAYLLHSRRKGNVSEEEQIFGLDMKRAFAEVEAGLPTPVVHSAEDVHRNVEIILEGGAAGLAKVKAALAWAAKLPVVGMDYETNGLRPYEAGSKTLTAAVANGDRAIAFPIDHPEARWNKAERDDLLHIWGRFLREARGVKAVHNAAFEMEWAAVKIEEDLIRAGKWECTQAQACILDERKGKKKAGPLSLEFLVQQYFGFNLKKLAGVDRKNLEETPLEAVLLYNAPDARYHCLLWEQQNIRIEEEGLREAATLAQRRVPTCVLSQIRGLIVDQTEVQRLQKKYEKAIDKTLVEIAALPVIQEFKRKKGKDFKPLSNPDVLYVFRDLLHRNEVLVENKFTKKREYSADESVLERIDHPLAELLLSLRHYNKRKATYIDPLDAEHEESVIFSDSLIHAQINTTFSEAGRLSIESPSLQNFPKRDNEAKEVRKQIVAAPKCVILAFDFGQIEARILAAFTQDKSFCKALWERYDVHQEWAERLAYAYPRRVGGKQNLKDKKAMKAFRTDVKNQWTFPLFYGAKLESAAGYLDIPVDTIRPLYNAFWKQFAGVKAWQEKQVERYNELGYTECLTGRRRHGPLSLNQILNSPVQGSAAEMVMLAMSRLSETGDPDLQPEINIHDDLTFARVDEKRVDDVAEKILNIMLDPKVFSWINFPVVVEGSIGMNWLEMEEFGVFSSDDWYK